MKTRIISAIVMLLLLILVYLGGIWLKMAVVIISVIGLDEFYKGFKAGVMVSGFLIGSGLTIDIFNAIKKMKLEFNVNKPEETTGEPEPPKESEDKYEPSYAD